MSGDFYTLMVAEWLSCQEQTNTLFWQERTGQIKRETIENIKHKKESKIKKKGKIIKNEQPDMFDF
jgi:hypothetical protein